MVFNALASPVWCLLSLCLSPVSSTQGTVVAIKRLLTDDTGTIERFVSEVRLLARLRHPNLILFMGYCIMPELCIVSEYMSKGSLYSVLHSQEQRKQRAAVRAALPAPQAGAEAAGSQVVQEQQLQGQPSLVEGQLPLSEEIRYGVAWHLLTGTTDQCKCLGMGIE